MATGCDLTVLVVDPGLFTTPYDAGLIAGLRKAGVRARWIGRPLRRGEEAPPEEIEPIYYRGAHESAKGRGWIRLFRKAASHVSSSLRLLWLAERCGCDLVHFQWLVVPVVDRLLIAVLSLRRPVVVTVHDLTPFNGAPSSALQRRGFRRALGQASQLIVHTREARDSLVRRGFRADRVRVVPHGPLALAALSASQRCGEPSPSAPWRIVLFGKLQPYKGLQVLVEALGLMAPEPRSKLKVIVAGEPLMDLAPIQSRIDELELGSAVELRPHHLTEEEAARLLGSADAFVLPYSEIQASGVLHLVLPLRRWIVATEIGAFRELIIPGENGSLVSPRSPDQLATALVDSIGRAPDAKASSHVPDWEEIGEMTRAVYESALAQKPARPARVAHAPSHRHPAR